MNSIRTWCIRVSTEGVRKERLLLRGRENMGQPPVPERFQSRLTAPGSPHPTGALDITLPHNNWRQRPHQMRLRQHLQEGGHRAMAVWHGARIFTEQYIAIGGGEPVIAQAESATDGVRQFLHSQLGYMLTEALHNIHSISGTLVAARGHDRPHRDLQLGAGRHRRQRASRKFEPILTTIRRVRVH